MEAAFDTLAYAERLKAAGIETSHANALTDALRVALGEGVATKADIREVRRELGADIAGLANRIDNIEENMVTKLDLARVDKRIEVLDKRIDGIDKRIDNIDENMATKTDLARLETQVQRSINRAMFAMAGLMVALAAAIITAIGLM